MYAFAPSTAVPNISGTTSGSLISSKRSGKQLLRSRKRTPRMVLDQPAPALDDVLNMRHLGIGDLWTEPTSRCKQNPNDDTYDPAGEGNDKLPIENLTMPGPIALPWDTTTGVQGMSYLQRRLRYLSRRKRVLSKSYEECERITALFSKTFYLGSSLLTPEKKRAVHAIYTWCRRTDDLVDGPRVIQRSNELHSILEDWGNRLDDIFQRRFARDHLDLALVDTVEKFPYLCAEPFHDMIAGMVMDVNQATFETFNDLYLYCYRVAGTVGLMSLPIVGTRVPGRRGLRQAAEPAVALGVGFQLTNILRDVGEDRMRGRVYLPKNDMAKFDYSEQDVFNCVRDSRYIALMQHMISRARKFFRLAERGIDMLAPDARLTVRAALDMYSQILDVLEFNEYDNFTKRAYVSKSGKLLTVPVSWMRIQNNEHWNNVANFCDKFRGRHTL